jgi:hypothetical protein
MLTSASAHDCNRRNEVLKPIVLQSSKNREPYQLHVVDFNHFFLIAKKTVVDTKKEKNVSGLR